MTTSSIAIIGLSFVAFFQAAAGNAQTIGNCMQSFSNVQRERAVTIWPDAQSYRCGVLDDARAQLMPSVQLQRQIGDLQQKAERIRTAIAEAEAQRNQEMRKLAVASGKTALKGAAAAVALHQALTCVRANPLSCPRKIAKAQKRAESAVDSYFDEFETSSILKQSSDNLLDVLAARGVEVDAELVEARAKTDAFLALCIIVARECVSPPVSLGLH